MVVLDGFRLQASRPAALGNSSVKRGVLMRLGMWWFGGLVTRNNQERTKDLQSSSQYQYHRVPVISAFGAPGTREYPVVSAPGTLGSREYSALPDFCALGTREYSVISAFGTPGTESFKMTGTRESMAEDQ